MSFKLFAAFRSDIYFLSDIKNTMTIYYIVIGLFHLNLHIIGARIENLQICKQLNLFLVDQLVYFMHNWWAGWTGNFHGKEHLNFN